MKTDFTMKNIIALLLLILITSCKSDFDEDNLKYEIHKFYVKNSEQITCLGYDLKDYNKISIDSIQEYSKHIYLQEKIKSQKQLKASIDKKMNSKIYTKVIELYTQKIDSLLNVFSKTDKDEFYYKCYFSYPEMNRNVIMLNEKYKPIECRLEIHLDI